MLNFTVLQRLLPQHNFHRSCPVAISGTGSDPGSAGRVIMPAALASRSHFSSHSLLAGVYVFSSLLGSLRASPASISSDSSDGGGGG